MDVDRRWDRFLSGREEVNSDRFADLEQLIARLEGILTNKMQEVTAYLEVTDNESHGSYFVNYSVDIRNHLDAAGRLTRANPGTEFGDDDAEMLTGHILVTIDALERLVQPVFGGQALCLHGWDRPWSHP